MKFVSLKQSEIYLQSLKSWFSLFWKAAGWSWGPTTMRSTGDTKVCCSAGGGDWDAIKQMARKERWEKVTSIHLPQEKKIIKLIFASINRKDESTLLKCSGYRSVPPCISNGGHRYVTGTTLSKFSSMQWLSCRALSPQVSSLIQHLENTPSAISNCEASAWDH